MAQAQFHKHQKVFVKPVGTWALVEKVIPQWVKGLNEPFRITYDVGMGREFNEEELQANAPLSHDGLDLVSNWYVERLRNTYLPLEECAGHPEPGTIPSVITNDISPGGWRVPGAEYDQDPEAVELQARIFAKSLVLMQLAKTLVDYQEQFGENLPSEIAQLANEARTILKSIIRN